MEERFTALGGTCVTQTPSFSDLLKVFGRIGLISFGGPAGQIALMHREIVEERRWVEEGAYLRALNVCHLLPGPEAQQLATWIGWRLHGAKGGLAAGLLFVVPGALVMLGLSILYATAANLSLVAALFLGIKAAVLAIVVQALLRIGGRALNTRFKVGLAVAAFATLFLLALPFPLVVIGAGVIGFVVARSRPDWLKAHGAPTVGGPAGPLPIGRTARTVALWLLVWAAPMLLVLLTLGQGHVLWKIGVFFSQLAIVTFGGAYAVLAYMAQEAVQQMHWLSAGEMTDGLGLAETTPGPLIMVTQFVGFLGAYRAPEPFSPLMAGILGAALTTWVTFAPCFLWIFSVAPWMERLERMARLQGALAAITAAVVGVIANLTLWFALHVLFARVEERHAGPLRLLWPDAASLDWRIALLACGAAWLIFRVKRGVMTVLGICAVAGVVMNWLG
jgi:chromate transporter